jgi:hypothetical protein
MPGTQPRGTHSFDPGSSLHSAQMLDDVNAEEDGAEDRDGPPLDLHSSIPSLVTPDHILPSVISSFFPSNSSSSSATRPPSSSSIPATVHPTLNQQHDTSMGSVHSREIGSDAVSSQLADSVRSRKRKHDGRSASGARAPSSKRSLKSKTSELNPVIMSNALNSTLNRLADVMEKSLDASATALAPAAPPIPNTTPASIESQTAQLSSQSNPPLASPEEILNRAIQVVTYDDSLSEDDLFVASLFFNSASEDAVRAARTFVGLSNNQVVQRRFLLRQLDEAALRPGKGKGRAVEDDDHLMTY